MLTYTQKCNGNCRTIWVSKCQTGQNEICSSYIGSTANYRNWSNIADGENQTFAKRVYILKAAQVGFWSIIGKKMNAKSPLG